MKLRGTIRRSDLEGGHWVFDADGGERYQLVGKIDAARDGMRAEVEGKVDKGAMGIAMTGPQLSVTKISALWVSTGHLPIVDYAASTGALRTTYDLMMQRPLPPAYRPSHGGVPGIITAHSADPKLIPLVFGTSTTLNGAGPLSWSDRELVNAVTSRLNQCLYWASCHAEFLRVATGDAALPRAVLADPRAVATRVTSTRVRALAELATLVTEAPWSLSRAHHDRAIGAGLDEGEVLHAVALSAYFGHLNRIADAVGVPLDYAVERVAPAAEPATPRLLAAPAAVGRAGHASTSHATLAARPATAAALEAWRDYVMDRDAPLPRDARRATSRWVAALLGDGLTEMATAIDVTDAELRALVTTVTLAPWQLGPAAYAPLRARGMDDAALFDIVVVASTAGVVSRISVALAALHR